jgi:cytochrome c5
MFLLALLFSLTASAADRCDFSKNHYQIKAVADPIAIKAKDVLTTHCAGCHGLGATGGAGVFNNILNVDELVRDGFVNLTDPPNSRVFKAINGNPPRMPKGGPPLALADRTAILDWIKAGVPGFDDVAPLPSSFVSYPQEIACASYDAERLDYRKKNDAKNYRYLSLANVYNSGNAARFQNLVWAVDKALNQTAFGPVDIVNSVPLDAAGVIRRIDLRNYAYNAADWDITLLGRYLFTINFANGTHFTREVRDEIKDYEEDLALFTASPNALIRADFFVNEVLGDLYYDFLFDRGVADNLGQLEKTLAVDANTAIANFENDSAVIRRSGVSLWNRVIHRYDAEYLVRGVKTTGSYWKTFDVINEIANRNFFAFPLGPEGVKFDFFTTKVFEFDAGEMIFTLPNKLQGYYIADAKGNRLQVAATNVAVDRENVDPYIGNAPGEIGVGARCNHCHGGGVNFFTEQLRYHSERTSGFTNDEYNAIHELFPEQATWNASFASYNTTFMASQTRVVADAKTTLPEAEPTWLATRAFLDYLSVEDAAGEFNMTIDEFKRCLYHAPELAQALGLSETGQGRVARDALEDGFDDVVKECGLGNQVLFKGVKPAPIKPPDKCQFSIKNSEKYDLLIKLKSNPSKIHGIAPGQTFYADQEEAVGIYVSTSKWVKFDVDCRAYEFINGTLR